MKIEIKKKTNYQCEYKVMRDNKSIELITLETKTYLVHDICHFVVEKNLRYTKGFWGMLSQGHKFEELFGKDNPLTPELRFIEQIVGPVQSAHSGHIPIQIFNTYVEHLNFTMTEDILSTCLNEIKSIIENWEHLTIGENMILEWRL